MNRKENNSKKWLCTGGMLTAIIVLSILTVGALPASAQPTVARSIEPDTVAPGGVVDVTIEFTTTVSNLFLDLNDYVPIGWTVTDMSANIEPDNTGFDPATGEVFFRWIGVPISSGTNVRAEYKLHVPAGWLDIDTYHLEGVLQRSAEPRDIPISGDDSVCVKLPYDVTLSVDDNTKETDANVDVFYYITVENTGVNEDTYELEVGATEADFAELSQSLVTLGPCESDVVVLRVLSSLAGDYDTTVEAASIDASDAITVTTTVEPFYDVSLGVSPEEKQVQTNEIAVYTVTVTNHGNAADMIDLSIIDFGIASASAEYRSLSEDTFALGAGEDATAYFNITSAAAGIYEKTVKGSSQGDHLVSDAVVTTLTVIPRTAAPVPTVTRTITPDTVAPGDVVNVVIEFTTTDTYLYLYLSDNVPEGWNVPEESMSENSGVPEDFKFLGFDETEGEVYFKWVPIEDPEDPGMEPGTHIIAEYVLHVPADALAGEYDLQGDLTLRTDFNPASDPSIAFVEGDETVTVELGPVANGTVSGNITHACNGTEVEGATVKLITPGGVEVDSTTTNADGNYEFTDVTPGDYYVNASKSMFRLSSTYETVGAGETVTVDMSLLLQGDLDNDCHVDWTDFLMFADVYGSSVGDPNYNVLADLDNDGAVDWTDFLMFADVYGT